MATPKASEQGKMSKVSPAVGEQAPGHGDLRESGRTTDGTGPELCTGPQAKAATAAEVIQQAGALIEFADAKVQIYKRWSFVLWAVGFLAGLGALLVRLLVGLSFVVLDDELERSILLCVLGFTFTSGVAVLSFQLDSKASHLQGAANVLERECWKFQKEGVEGDIDHLQRVLKAVHTEASRTLGLPDAELRVKIDGNLASQTGKERTLQHGRSHNYILTRWVLAKSVCLSSSRPGPYFMLQIISAMILMFVLLVSSIFHDQDLSGRLASLLVTIEAASAGYILRRFMGGTIQFMQRCQETARTLNSVLMSDLVIPMSKSHMDDLVTRTEAVFGEKHVLWLENVQRRRCPTSQGQAAKGRAASELEHNLKPVSWKIGEEKWDCPILCLTSDQASEIGRDRMPEVRELLKLTVDRPVIRLLPSCNPTREFKSRQQMDEFAEKVLLPLADEKPEALIIGTDTCELTLAFLRAVHKRKGPRPKFKVLLFLRAWKLEDEASRDSFMGYLRSCCAPSPPCQGEPISADCAVVMFQTSAADGMPFSEEVWNSFQHDFIASMWECSPLMGLQTLGSGIRDFRMAADHAHLGIPLLLLDSLNRAPVVPDPQVQNPKSLKELLEACEVDVARLAKENLRGNLSASHLAYVKSVVETRLEGFVNACERDRSHSQDLRPEVEDHVYMSAAEVFAAQAMEDSAWGREQPEGTMPDNDLKLAICTILQSGSTKSASLEHGEEVIKSWMKSENMPQATASKTLLGRAGMLLDRLNERTAKSSFWVATGDNVYSCGFIVGLLAALFLLDYPEISALLALLGLVIARLVSFVCPFVVLDGPICRGYALMLEREMWEFRTSTFKQSNSAIGRHEAILRLMEQIHQALEQKQVPDRKDTNTSRTSLATPDHYVSHRLGPASKTYDAKVRHLGRTMKNAGFAALATSVVAWALAAPPLLADQVESQHSAMVLAILGSLVAWQKYATTSEDLERCKYIARSLEGIKTWYEQLSLAGKHKAETVQDLVQGTEAILTADWSTWQHVLPRRKVKEALGKDVDLLQVFPRRSTEPAEGVKQTI